jgi:ribosomal protein L7/L12
VDKVSFAQLIALICRMTGNLLDKAEITEIEDAITRGMPKVANPDLIEDLLASMKAGKYIDAIKAHRALTGFGLKESKDVIDHYRNFNVAGEGNAKSDLIQG